MKVKIGHEELWKLLTQPCPCPFAHRCFRRQNVRTHIGADSNMVDTHQSCNMIDVSNDVGNICTIAATSCTQEIRERMYADDPTFRSNSADDVIRDISRMWAK